MLALAVVGTAPTASSTTAARVDAAGPLALTIDDLSPAWVPASGPIRITGSVTNNDDAPWANINVYAFISEAPLTSSAALAEAAQTATEIEVGARITTPGTFDTIGDLAPGQTAQYTIRVPREQLGVSAPGVYWFGVHALGDGPEGRVTGADGRARTFLPLLPRNADPVDTALVVPLRNRLARDPDGSLDNVAEWTRILSPGGRLRGLVDFGAAAGTRQMTWLVDPALIDAVRALAAGNPPRSLAPIATEETEQDPTSPDPSAGASGAASTGASSDPSAEPSIEPDPEAPRSLNPVPPELAEAATSWLNRLQNALERHPILGLPYGDVDVSAAAQYAPALLDEAWQRSASAFQAEGLSSTPAVSSPNGYLNPMVLPTINRRTTVLVTDTMFPGEAPASARSDGLRLIWTSAGAADGGPGPEPALSTMALRQRVLAEAAVRALAPDPRPLVVVFPQDWTPTAVTEFFQGLDADWIRLTSVPQAAAGEEPTVSDSDLIYPAGVQRRELDPDNFTAAAALQRRGERLAEVLTNPSNLSSQVTAEALADVSYTNRRRADLAKAAADRSRRWIDNQLASITITAPRAVTLSSASGRFAATVTNGLDQPVEVSVRVRTDPNVTVTVPESVSVAAGGSQTVLITASTNTPGVHRLLLAVTDRDGNSLGARDTLPIRSAQVSNIIWLILATGVVLLFTAITIRLVRRVRTAAHLARKDTA